MTQAQVSTIVKDPASVDAAIESRFSARAFLPTPVSREQIADILRVASRAASGTNTQPWKVYVLQGKSLDGLVAQVSAAHDAVYADPALAASYREDYDYYPDEVGVTLHRPAPRERLEPVRPAGHHQGR